MRATSAVRPIRRALLSCASLLVAWAALTTRAQPPSTVPPDGLRENTPAVHALVNARLVLSPGRTVERGTVVVRDGTIVAVGDRDDVPRAPDGGRWDTSGRTADPGLIDAWGELADAPG